MVPRTISAKSMPLQSQSPATEGDVWYQDFFVAGGWGLARIVSQRTIPAEGTALPCSGCKPAKWFFHLHKFSVFDCTVEGEGGGGGGGLPPLNPPLLLWYGHSNTSLPTAPHAPPLWNRGPVCHVGASVWMCSGMPWPCCLIVSHDRPWNAFSRLKRQ